MVVNKNIDGKVVKITTDTNTYYTRTNTSIKEHSYISAMIYIDKDFIGNFNYGNEHGEKRLLIDRTMLKELGIELIIRD